MATFTFQFGDDFITELAAAIVKLQLHGETVKPPENRAAPPDDDPWSTAAPGPSSPAGTATAPSGGIAAPSTPAPTVGPTVEIVNTPKGAQTWTLNLPAAPRCLCGQQSAHIQGSTNGRTWARYGCAKGKDKSTYRSKCDFSEWA